MERTEPLCMGEDFVTQVICSDPKIFCSGSWCGAVDYFTRISDGPHSKTHARHTLNSLVLSLFFAALSTCFGTWVVLRPQGVIDRFLHADDRTALAGKNWLWFIRLLGIGLIVLGLGQLVETLVR